MSSARRRTQPLLTRKPMPKVALVPWMAYRLPMMSVQAHGLSGPAGCETAAGSCPGRRSGDGYSRFGVQVGYLTRLRSTQ